MDNIPGAMEHLETHQTYPATKDELVKACNGLSDFSSEDKKWFMDHLQDKTYNSAQEVMDTLGLSKK